MANLKDLRVRISSVKSTQKITSAMKMVAASKLRKAQMAAEASRPYAERMERMVGALAKSAGGDGAPKLLAGSGKEDVHLLVGVSANRGLCGGFNAYIVKELKARVAKLRAEGKSPKLLLVGRKANDVLKREYKDIIVGVIEEQSKGVVGFNVAEAISMKIQTMFNNGEIDVATVIYNRFESAISQVVTGLQVIPFAVAEDEGGEAQASDAQGALVEYEPNEEEILNELLPRNLSVQIYRSLLESEASEHGARMTAMDNATRNAGDMINNLTLTYNRTRQAYITKELIEIISGAEAL